MGKTDPRNPNPYKQQSVILVPAGHPGVTVERALTVYGYDGTYYFLPQHLSF